MLAVLGLSLPAWAGQVNLSSRSTTILETITNTIASTNTSSISTGGISTTVTAAPYDSNVIRSVLIVETFNSASATVSFEVAQEDINYTSPHDNIHLSPTIAQLVTIASSAGITNVQTTAGAGNVSIASNGLLDGTALHSIVGSLAATPSTAAAGAQVATLALVPGFALQNSNANALTQAAVMAIANGQTGLNVTAIDVQQAGLNEYSPFANIAINDAGVSQGVQIDGTSGMTSVSTQAGAGNVQATHSVILFNAGAIDGGSNIFP